MVMVVLVVVELVAGFLGGRRVGHCAPWTGSAGGGGPPRMLVVWPVAMCVYMRRHVSMQPDCPSGVCWMEPGALVGLCARSCGKQVSDSTSLSCTSIKSLYKRAADPLYTQRSRCCCCRRC